ncbi:MAG TPA: Crp/Fnr family transcriptional regulator [Cyclobacteriaceae bacterium]|nr:Crp/Fnr family transcriptional regulator [Cyclobacteriaceae bacterium]
MEHPGLINYINKYISLDKAEALHFQSLLLPVRLRQNEMIENAGEVTSYLIHVLSGCLMTYYTDKQDNDHVIQFSTATWWTGDLHSFSKQVPSIYSTRALADSEILLFPFKEFEGLLTRIPKFERLFRIIFQNSLVTHQFRIIQNFSTTAEERYEDFLKRYPSLEQYVPQKYIASYLGITPEFLSKIRRKRMER